MCTFYYTTKATRPRRACRLRSHDFECDVLIIDTGFCKEYGEPVASGKQHIALLPVIFWVPITSETVVNIIKANRGEHVASSRPTTPVRFVIARFFPSALHCLFSSRFSRPLGPFRVRSSRLPGFFTCSLAPRCFAPAHDSIVVHYFRLQIARLDYITKPQTHQRKDSHCLDMQSIPA